MGAAESLAGLGQGGAVEAAGLGGVQFRGVGQDGAPLGPVGLAAGVERGQGAEPLLVNHGCGGGGQGGQVRAVAGGTDPM